MVIGRSDLVLYIGILNKTITVFALVLTIKFEIETVIIGYLIASIICYIPNSYYTSRLLNYTVKEQIRDVLPCLTLSLFLFMLIYQLQRYTQFSPILELFAYSVSSLIFYFFFSYLFKFKAIQIIIDEYQKINGYKSQRTES